MQSGGAGFETRVAERAPGRNIQMWYAAATGETFTCYCDQSSGEMKMK